MDTLACIALAGKLPEFFPLLEWSYAVKKSFMSQEVVTCANRDQWNEVCTMLQEVSNTELSLRSKNGTTLWTRANPCLPTPEDDAFPLQVLTPPPTRELARMPEVVQIEATGLGGKNLGEDRPWDISIRTDPEGQNVYGPSVATVEDIVIEPDESGGMSTRHVTSLGISKAAHEFLTLHYFALDSAEWWEQILGELLPNAQFPAAVIRRTIAYQMFMAAHIAPSHRRPPHPVWEDSLSLIADLLFGSGVDRYVGAMQRTDSPLEVNVRGFSAGSYSGLAFLHILWSIPRVTTKGCLGAIACPPALLSMSRAKRADRLHLIHYENDSLCSWKPGLQQIQGCCTSFTYITNEIASYKGHFGPDDHDYSHWMALELPHGSYALRVLLFIRPAAASKARRDATPLRLISWLSYKLNPELEQFIEKAMEHLSTWTETEGGKVLTMGKEAIPRGGTVDSEEELRNELIELISVGNLKYKPQALFTLFRQFLTRISLQRLIHFMDLVLPQLTPVQVAWAGEEKTLWSCHYIRWLRERHSDATPRVQISYFFSSHDNIHHVRIQWNSNPLLLFTDPTMVEALPVEHFSQQASHMTHQQHLQMGLRKGMAILIYYVIGGTHYQAVLLAEESVMNRGKRGENRLWKRVTPSVTEFAWLPPNLAESFCKNALYREEVRTYCAFDTPHLGLDTKNFVADVFVENILYLGDTRSADDLSVFTKMAPERLCLGCGLRVDEPFAPISTGERKKLFYAAQKLLTFVLHEVSAQTLSGEETALKIALRPLIINKDGHFVAAVTSMYQSLLEGKTDCPISGVFGAGKTLSAAAMIAGLLVMDPSLTIMIVTKENVAAHAFVKHFLRLGLPESINCLVGRLVGYVEMKKGPANQTALDIPPAFRNDVLRSKRVIVGCGGGFHQECQQPYSPVASWMEEADVALNDEGQQYGNLDEASAIARVPRKCLVVWCGDHKQTPGGLRKTDEAKAFRRKLLRRPIALRGDTKHLQPNMLGKVVLRYLDGMDEPLINRVQVILRATMGGRSVVGCPYHEELRSTASSVALVVLWMGLRQEKFPLLATTLQAAAGVSGPQKWALILPSSARVSLVTYTAVIAVRYPELDNVQNDLICFGNYLLGEQATSGGFLPLFWDAPSAYMHAATDIGSAVDWLQSQVELNSDENGCLAVLHNRNKMVATFGNSEWVTQSDGAVQSKSVTSCAGMTAHFVLLAQTKVGFLSGGRGRHMKELSENEVLAQLEEAYARATVALTRAQELCIIMGPLDMRGLPGAATVIGCLKYGAGGCGVHDSNQAAEVFLKDGSLNDGPDDDAFLQSLRRSLKTARGAYPPVAWAEIYQEFKSPLTMIRRLHLMVVDLDRSRSVSPQVYRDFMNCRGSLDPAGSLNTLPVPISGKEVPFQTRYVFAYGMDNSDRPCYLLWPIRGGNGQFLLVDPWSGNYFDLEAAKFVKPIGIEHFFDAFSLEKKRPLKSDAASALNIQVKDVSDSLVVNQDKAKRFELTPVWAPAEPPAKRAKTAEVRLSSASNVPRPPQSDDNEKGSSEEEDSDSSGSNSDVSSQDDSSDVSDLEKFDEAYTDFGALTQDVDPRTLERDGSTNQNEEVPGIDLPGGMKALHSLANVPKSWPLARLTIPLSAASKHLERLLEGCCNEIYVRNTNPDLQLHFVRKFAKDLVVVLAFHLAETIAALFRHVLHHPSKVLYDPETEPLFLPLFWFYPIYREMLNSASRHRPSKSMELRRAASGLVKVICRTEDSRPNGRGKKPGKPKQKGLLASFEEWFGSINMMNILYVWFPASWGPSVVEAIQTRNVTCLAKKPIVRDPHIFDRKEAARGSRAREVTCRIQKWNIKAEGFHPILVANARVDWLAMDDEDITKKFPILLEGILQDVYSQRAASAWQGAQPQKLTVSMLLPGTSSAAEWRDLLQSRRQFWPTLTTRHASLVPVSVEALQRERRQMQAKHLWYNVNIRWSDLKDKLEVLAPTGLTRDDIWRHLFLTKQRKNPYEEGSYTGEDVEDVKQKWEDKKHYFEQYKKDGACPPCIDLDRATLGFNIDNTAAFQAIEDSKALHARRWQTKEGTYRIKRRALPDVRDEPLQDDNAAASCSDGKPRWRCWDGDYAMGFQHHT